ncbi:hypothetical protein VTN77DRAFT_4072 [Rasamsonia byssochlamydoides]|uniref:uncharacterized protein n=1 Tax=Rasamsonia byssochlamydoides TaxID=89139 RepID=UPI003743EDBF
MSAAAAAAPPASTANTNNTNTNSNSNAQSLREKGNALYKRGKVNEAIKTYRQAAQLARQDDYLPWSNLSAAYFEAGKYVDCVENGLQALKICNGHDNDHAATARADAASAAFQKLATRLIKAYLHTHQYQSAKFWLDQLQLQSQLQDPELTLYRTAIDRAEAVWTAFPDERNHRLHLQRRLPRYRPAFSGYHEFFNVGHDDISDLIPVDVLVDLQKDVSVFLGGVGDARHFYSALALLGVTEQAQLRVAQKTGADELSRVKRRYHFTLNDLKAGALARDMVLFALLDELAVARDLPSLERLQRYAVVFYIFIGAIMPRFAFDHLNRVIDMLVEKLDRKEPILPWLRLYESDRAELLRALRSWRSDALLSLYSTADIISMAQFGLKEASIKATALYGFDPRRAPPGCEKEYATYHEAPFLLPPRPVLKQHEPELETLLETGASMDQLRKYLGENWCVNPTLLDEDWMIKAKGELDVGFNPFELATRLEAILVPEEKGARRRTKLFDYVTEFFQMVVMALRRVRNRLTVEMLLDDLAAVIDSLRHGLVEGRDQDAPTAFDVVHLSNVPDYIGGSFVTLVSGLKILNNTTAKITSTCLRNTSIWKSHEHFHSEYMLVNDFNTLFKLTQAQLVKRDQHDNFFPMSGYMDWRRATMEAFPYETLLHRAEVTRWLYAHFFKMALPCGRSLEDHNVDHFLYPTLNLTNFFWLLIHLHEIGYPGHWLAEVLAKILEDQVVTTARPPRTLPLDVDEVSRRHPPAKLSTAPYIAEMSTLTVLFQRLLPFSLTTTASLPSPASIYSYSIRMREVSPPFNGEMAAMVLIFFRQHVHTRCPGTALDIHRLLDSSPEKDPGFETAAAREFREEGCVVVTTFAWSGMEDRTATFWMREDVMERMRRASSEERDSWVCALWRVDDWTMVSTTPEDVECVVRGERWVE